MYQHHYLHQLWPSSAPLCVRPPRSTGHSWPQPPTNQSPARDCVDQWEASVGQVTGGVECWMTENVDSESSLSWAVDMTVLSLTSLHIRVTETFPRTRTTQWIKKNRVKCRRLEISYQWRGFNKKVSSSFSSTSSPNFTNKSVDVRMSVWCLMFELLKVDQDTTQQLMWNTTVLQLLTQNYSELLIRLQCWMVLGENLINLWLLLFINSIITIIHQSRSVLLLFWKILSKGAITQ